MLLSKKRIWTFLLCSSLAVQSMAGLAWGQASSTAGAIGGTITDQAGALISGATVKVRNVDTGLERSLKTSEGGNFRFPTLSVGNYEVTVDAPGFGQIKRSGIVLRVGDDLDLKLALAAAGTTEVVNVTAEAPVAEPSKTEIATTIGEKAITELPINGRRWSNFVTLTPGVTPDGNFGLISFRGISGLLNNSTIDGGDNNQAFFSEERGRTRLNYTISQEAVKEFQVNTQNYSPEFGRAAGGVVNAVTKSGTNEVHGSGFYYIRDDVFNARNPLDFITIGFKPDNSPILQAIKPPDRRQQFGGTLGGPVKKDKAFWFFSYDQQKRNFPYNAQPSSPNFFSDCVDGVTGAPTGTCAAAIGLLLPQTGVAPRRGDQWIFLPKVDWQLNEKNLFTASYNYLKWNSPNGIQTQPVVNTAASNNGPDKVRVDSFNARLVTTVSNSMLNEGRFQYGRDLEQQIPNAPNSVGVNIGTTGQGNSGTGFNVGIAEFLPRNKFPNEIKYQFVDNYTITKGAHTLKLGGELVRNNEDIDNLRFGAGYYNYGLRNNRQGITNLGLDLTTPGARNYSTYTQAFGPSGLIFHTWDYSVYAQDEWKVRQNITLNYGLRYERIVMPDVAFPNPLVNQTLEMPTDKDNLGPRIGVAWDVRNDRKNVLRAGYGIYYGRVINSAIYNALTVTGAPGSVLNYRFTATNGPVYPNKFAAPPTGVAATTPDIFFLQDNLQAPKIHQADVVFEREILPSMSVSASYLMSRGKSLPFFFDTNMPTPNRTQTFLVLDANGAVASQVKVPIFNGGAAARPNKTYGRMIEQRSDVESRYDAFVIGVNKRFTHGIQFLAHFTYSRSQDLDQVSQTFSATFPTALNQYDLEGDRGRSNFDVPKRFVASFVWELPFLRQHENHFVKNVLAGWKVNGIVTIQDGARVTGSTGSLPSFKDPDGTSVVPIASSINGSGGVNRTPFIERNSYQRPALQNIDLRFAKEFRVKERYRLDFIAEAFNLFNHTNAFGVVTSQYDVITVSPSGQVTTGCSTAATTGPCLPAFRPRTDFLRLNGAQSTLYRERQMQLALRFQF